MSPLRELPYEISAAAVMCLVCLTCLAASSSAQESTEPIRQIIISGTQQRLAVPPCVPQGTDDMSRDACATLTRVLRDDLAFQALFKFVDEGLYSALRRLDPDAPVFEDWQSIYANFLIAVRADASARGLAVDLRVYSVDTAELILSQHYAGQIEDARALAHKVADAFMALTQYAGVAQSRIVFSSDRDDRDGNGSTKELYMSDYDGHNVRRVTVNRSLNILPHWSPSGDGLAYVSYRGGAPDVYIASLLAGQSLNLTRGAGQSFAPAWSPDGSKVAFGGTRSGNMEVWSVNADGSGMRNLTQNRATDTAPTWSPNGRMIAFTSDRGGTPQIWVMGADGLNVRRLTAAGNYSDGAMWSPSRLHSEIAYTSRLESGTFEIAVLDLVTSQVRQLTTGRGSCEGPSWSANGRHLVFSCNRQRRWQLAMCDRLGYQLRTLDVGAGQNVYPDWSR